MHVTIAIVVAVSIVIVALIAALAATVVAWRRARHEVNDLSLANAVLRAIIFRRPNSTPATVTADVLSPLDTNEKETPRA